MSLDALSISSSFIVRKAVIRKKQCGKSIAVDLFDCWQGNRESIPEHMRESSLEYAPSSRLAAPISSSWHCHGVLSLLPPSFSSPETPYAEAFLYATRVHNRLRVFMFPIKLLIKHIVGYQLETPYAEAFSYPTRVHNRLRMSCLGSRVSTSRELPNRVHVHNIRMHFHKSLLRDSLHGSLLHVFITA